MGNLDFTTDQVQQRLAQGYYDDIKAAGYTGAKAQLDAILAKAGLVMKAATASAAGGAGLVPAPGAGAQAKYLRGDGTWQTTPNSVYTHPTTAGNKHIPSGGVAGQFLKWSADGTAVWAADNNTTYSAMKAATASVAGTAGLVPAPPAGAQNKFLKGDGTWAEAAGGGGNDFYEFVVTLDEQGNMAVPAGTYTNIMNALMGGMLLKLIMGIGESEKMSMIAQMYTIDESGISVIVTIGPAILLFSITSTDLIVAIGELSYLTSGDISDNLTSSSIKLALSANQGRILNDKITSKVRASTNAPTNGIGNDGDIWVQYSN